MLEKIEIHLLSKLMGMNHALWSHRFGGRLIESMSHHVDNMNTCKQNVLASSGTPNNLFTTKPEPFNRDVEPYHNRLIAPYLRGKPRTAHVSKYVAS